MDKLKSMTLLEASELVKAIEETFDVDASAGGCAFGGEDRVRPGAGVVPGRQEDCCAEGCAHHHRPRPQGGQGDGRGCPQGAQGGREQDRVRGGPEGSRGGWRRRRAQVEPSITQLTLPSPHLSLPTEMRGGALRRHGIPPGALSPLGRTSREQGVRARVRAFACGLCGGWLLALNNFICRACAVVGGRRETAREGASVGTLLRHTVSQRDTRECEMPDG